jgi:ubiquinone/menaquinone biosynthesis C-methylase UbiE
MATRMRPAEGYGGRPRRRREAWSIDNPGNRAARRELLTAIEDVAAVEIAGPRPLLDCGCGTGWLLEALAEGGVAPERLHGVDRDGGRVAAARERVPRATALVGDAMRLDYPNDTFAAVFFVVSLSSMGGRHAVRAAMAEGRRVLAPGGALVIYELRVPNPFNRGTRLVGDDDLTAAGVAPEHERSLTLLPALGRRMGAMTASLHPRLSRLTFLRTHRLIVARKPPRTSPTRHTSSG